MCLGMFLLRFILPGTCASWSWVTVSFTMLGMFSAIMTSNIFSGPFSLPFPCGDPYNANVGAFYIVPEVSNTVLTSFHSSSFILFQSSDFHHSVFQLIYLFFFLTYSAIDSSGIIFHFNYCIVHLYLFFRYLCQTFLISSWSVPPFFPWDLGLSLLSLFWIVFWVDCLSPLHLIVFLGLDLVPLSGT